MVGPVVGTSYSQNLCGAIEPPNQAGVGVRRVVSRRPLSSVCVRLCPVRGQNAGAGNSP